MSNGNTQDRPWALITGASEGLGKEFATQLAKRKTHNLILAARSESKLVSLASELLTKYETQSKVMVVDLSIADAASKLNERTKEFNVAILVNNAAVAFGGPFEDMHFQDVQRQTQINIAAFTELFHLFLPRIKEQHKRLAKQKHSMAGILNLSSTAAFMPIPSMAQYAATKAYVLSLSEAVYQEQRLEADKVPILCVCPGPTATEIWSKGGASAKSLLLPMMTSEQCCQIALRTFDGSDRATIITGYFNNLMTFGAVRLTPRSLVRLIAHRAMGQDPALRDAEEVKSAFKSIGREAPTRLSAKAQK